MVPVILSSLLREAAEHIHTHVRQDRGAGQGEMERDNANQDYESIDEHSIGEDILLLRCRCKCSIIVHVMEAIASIIPSLLHPPRAKADGLGRSEPAGG